jgi:hypothetical protein
MGNRLIRRARKEAAEKTVRTLMRRRFELRRYRRTDDRERVALEKPVFWVYRRHLILRKDIASRKDAKRLLGLLAIVQKEEDCRRKDFKRWDKLTHRWESWNHTPCKLSPAEYRKLPDDLQCFFESYQHDRWGRMYRVVHPWWFASRRRKLYLTHRFLPNIEREREQSYLEARVEQGQLMGIYTKVKSRRSSWGNDWNARKRKLGDLGDAKQVLHAMEIHAAGQLHLERGKEVICDA